MCIVLLLVAVAVVSKLKAILCEEVGLLGSPECAIKAFEESKHTLAKEQSLNSEISFRLMYCCTVHVLNSPVLTL